MVITNRDLYEYGRYLYHSSRFNDQTELLDCLKGVIPPTEGALAELRCVGSRILLGFEHAWAEDRSRMAFSEEWGLWDEGRAQWVLTGFGTEREADLIRTKMEKQMDEDDDTNLQIFEVERDGTRDCQ